MTERVNHPKHYTSHPSGVEVIEITEGLDFCVGNAVKYILRAPHKGSEVEDLEKALWYLRRRRVRWQADQDASDRRMAAGIDGPRDRILGVLQGAEDPARFLLWLEHEPEGPVRTAVFALVMGGVDGKEDHEGDGGMVWLRDLDAAIVAVLQLRNAVVERCAFPRDHDHG